MKVKICGLSEQVHVDAAVTSGADLIGFVFADSSRQVTVEQAHELVRTIPQSIRKVGVFVNPTLEELEQAIQGVPLDIVQLHGSEPPELIAKLSVPVIKAFSVRDGKLTPSLANYDEKTFLLVDAPPQSFQGGSGETFNWQEIDRDFFKKRKGLLAGGLTAENVQAGIDYFQPYGVDVSSGVETAGHKDANKIKAFIKKAKGARK